MNADHYPVPFAIIFNKLKNKEKETKKLLELCLKNKLLWNIKNGRTLCEKCHRKTYNFARNSYEKIKKTKMRKIINKSNKKLVFPKFDLAIDPGEIKEIADEFASELLDNEAIKEVLSKLAEEKHVAKNFKNTNYEKDNQQKQ